MDRPAVWFERALLPGLAEEVEAAVRVLGPAAATPHDPHAALGEALGAVVGADHYDAAVMDRGPRLRVIARTGIGYDRVDLDAATARGIAVCNAPDGPTVPTAEHAVALMLAAAKGLHRPAGFAEHASLELDGKTLGLVGLGRIAARVARIAQSLGMSIQAYDPFVAVFPPGVRRVPTLAAALDADVVSVHVPLTPETRHLMGPGEFAAMRRGAIFVNTARGGLVDQDALAVALDSGQVRAAALDVTEPEPLPAGHPLAARDDVIVTPHVASATPEGKERMFRSAFEQVMQVLQGERPAHLVNPEVWGRVGTGAA